MREVFKIIAGELLVSLVGILIIGGFVAWYAGGELIDPVPRYIGHPPRTLSVANASFVNGSGTLVHGWVAHGNAGQGVILLLHGLHGDRRDMIPRAQFLSRLGYSVLLIDFQGHGESRGSHVSFGFREAHDVVGAIQYLRYTMPNEPIGVIGASLGADAFVLTKEHLPVDAVVLESMYPSVRGAVESRLRVHVGLFAPAFAPLMAMQVRVRLGISGDREAIQDGLAHLGTPLLMASSTDDPDTPLEEERSLFAAASQPKEFWAVQGAGRGDLYEFAKGEYERRVAAFLRAHLKPRAQPPGQSAPQQAPSGDPTPGQSRAADSPPSVKTGR
ncbi:MAG TPA: alpha/beta fold hydrolase [Steroidobacteraceae bacterium]|jgi:pimeloyl-ACP methyl ester carboxylesterase